MRVNRHDDEVRQLLGRANALEHFALVDRIDRIGEAAMVGRLVVNAEQLELVGRLLLGQANGARGLLVSNLPQRSQLLGA